MRFTFVGEQEFAADGKKAPQNLAILMNWQKQGNDWKLLVPGRHQALIASRPDAWRSGRQRHPAGEPAGGALGLACVAKDLPFQAIETVRSREKPKPSGSRTTMPAGCEKTSIM